MRLTVLGIALLASASAIGEGYITSVRLPDGTTKTFQDAGARQEIQDILSQKYLKPESVKAGDNVSVTTNESGEVTISADISSTSPAFSNAVLSVGLGIDTNTVAAINELVDSSHGLPVSGMTSVGALLLALAAAIAALKRGKADRSDATLTPIYSDTPTFSEWTFSDVSDGITDIQQPTFIPYPSGESRWEIAFSYDGQVRPAETFVIDKDATNLTFEYGDEGLNLHITATRTRTDIIGYRLGSDSATNPNRDKPLASEAEAEALRQGKANKPATFTAGNLAALDASGNPTDAGWTAGDLARYALVTKTISNNAVTLDDRTFNKVTVADGITEVILNPPAEIPGKMRDFRLLLICGQNPPAITYGGYIIVVSEQDVNLPPPPGLNVYTFSEISRNQFIVTRKTPVVKSDNAPGTIESLTAAMAAMGYDTDGWTTLDDIRKALELPDTASIVDCVQKALYE